MLLNKYIEQELQKIKFSINIVIYFYTKRLQLGINKSQKEYRYLNENEFQIFKSGGTSVKIDHQP